MCWKLPELCTLAQVQQKLSLGLEQCNTQINKSARKKPGWGAGPAALRERLIPTLQIAVSRGGSGKGNCWGGLGAASHLAALHGTLWLPPMSQLPDQEVIPNDAEERLQQSLMETVQGILLTRIENLFALLHPESGFAAKPWTALHGGARGRGTAVEHPPSPFRLFQCMSRRSWLGGDMGTHPSRFICRKQIGLKEDHNDQTPECQPFSCFYPWAAKEGSPQLILTLHRSVQAILTHPQGRGHGMPCTLPMLKGIILWDSAVFAPLQKTLISLWILPAICRN